MATSLCLSDNRLGPRVSIDCRAFDFTLLFEDIFFTSLPAAILLILLPIRLWFLWHEPVKITSYRLAVCKLVKVPRYTFPNCGWPQAVPYRRVICSSGSVCGFSSSKIGASYPGFLTSSHTQHHSNICSVIHLLRRGPAICETLGSPRPLFLGV